MVTYETLYEAFFDKIEKDKDFFNYNNVSIHDALSIAKMRSQRYLKEALFITLFIDYVLFLAKIYIGFL